MRSASKMSPSPRPPSSSYSSSTPSSPSIDPSISSAERDYIISKLQPRDDSPPPSMSVSLRPSGILHTGRRTIRASSPSRVRFEDQDQLPPHETQPETAHTEHKHSSLFNFFRKSHLSDNENPPNPPPSSPILKTVAVANEEDNLSDATAEVASVNSDKIDTISKAESIISPLFSATFGEEETQPSGPLSNTPDLAFHNQYDPTTAFSKRNSPESAACNFDEEGMSTISLKLGKLTLEQQDSTMRDAFTLRPPVCDSQLFDICHSDATVADNSLLDSHEDILDRGQPDLPKLTTEKKEAIDTERIKMAQSLEESRLAVELLSAQLDASRIENARLNALIHKATSITNKYLKTPNTDVFESVQLVVSMLEDQKATINILNADKKVYLKESRTLIDTNNVLSEKYNAERRKATRVHEEYTFLEKETKETTDFLESELHENEKKVQQLNEQVRSLQEASTAYERKSKEEILLLKDEIAKCKTDSSKHSEEHKQDLDKYNNVMEETNHKLSSLKTKCSQLQETVVALRAGELASEQKLKEVDVTLREYTSRLKQQLSGQFELIDPMEFHDSEDDSDILTPIRNTLFYTEEVVEILLKQLDHCQKRQAEDQFRSSKKIRELRRDQDEMELKVRAYERFLCDKLPRKYGDDNLLKLRRIISQYSKAPEDQVQGIHVNRSD
ncbi:hypothetical protein WICPIJ_006131 [Wickerhamomyces pijperi]|uniref:Uncharacterized protein n=1 Tax=Wickerhamomyces pijperi TaxID=599730 RepID=A0A9P8Q2N7_WICPI|nr:hypothetical protein WICPIJ_006131 [Wickerhamomyces pijperi]